jgi:hypothetical protein
MTPRVFQGAQRFVGTGRFTPWHAEEVDVPPIGEIARRYEFVVQLNLRAVVFRRLS